MCIRDRGYAAYLHAFTCVYRENVRTGAMSQWSRESGRRVYERSRSVAEMLGDVDEFSQKRYTEQVGRFREDVYKRQEQVLGVVLMQKLTVDAAVERTPANAAELLSHLRGLVDALIAHLNLSLIHIFIRSSG